MTHEQLFKLLLGTWKGTSRTWFEPGVLADESECTGEFTAVLDGRFLRHTSQGTIKGKPRQGEELIAFNPVTKTYEMSWVDDFHMSSAILFSSGPGQERGFSVNGQYDVAENTPNWGWKTVYDLANNNQLLIVAYNITPEGEEAKAVEIVYSRVQQ